MHIEKIIFQNIRECFPSQEIPLEKGITAIVGPNGSGKSTLLEGISFCLSGQLESTQSQLRGGKGISSIEVGLSDGVVIKRISKSSQNFSLSIYDQGSLIDSRGVVDGIQWIADRYSWNSYLFTNSIYLKQSTGIDLLTKPYEARKFLISLLDLDRWNKFYKEAKDAIADVNINIQSYQQKMDTAEGVISGLSQLGTNFTGEDLKKLKDQIQEYQKEYEERIQSILDNVEKVELIKHRLEDKLSGFRSDISSEKKVLSVMESGKCPTCLRDFLVTESVLTRQKSSVQSIKDIIEKLNTAIQKADKNLFSLLREKTQIESDLRDRMTNLSSARVRIEEGLKLSDQISDDVRKYKVVISACNDKLQDLTFDKDEYEILMKAYSPNTGIPKLVLDKELVLLESYINAELTLLSKDSIQVKFITQKNNKETLECSVICNGSLRSNVYSLSGGQRKRINLASLFGLSEYCGANHILLLDEPTDALDDEGRVSFMNFLRHKLTKFNQILLATHDFRLVEMSDHVLKLG